jgi:hypothetical protein
MPQRDKRIDEHIREAAPFARPILRHLRKLIHQTCPKAEETIKWGMPHFMYEGKILCGIASFKAHCAFWFWEGKAVVGNQEPKAKKAMGQFGRITNLKDLPSAGVIRRYLKKAMKLNETKRPLKHQKPKRQKLKREK